MRQRVVIRGNLGIALLAGAAALYFADATPAAGDFDADGEVSICDAFWLPACTIGPAAAPTPECVFGFDFNADRHIDLRDVAAFQRTLDAAVAPRLPDLPTRRDVMIDALRVARHWIAGNPDPGDWEWNRGACFEGIVGLYHHLAEPELYDYAVRWGELNNWTLKGGATTRFADNQAAGQAYIELYQIDPLPVRLAAIQTSIDGMVASTRTDDWYWIDAIQMALPNFAKLGEMTGDPAYHLKGWDLFHHTYRIQGGDGLYSDNGHYAYNEHLWWRDQNYLPPYDSPHGDQVFWSRGNGWVFAGLARTLQHMQPTDPHYDDYLIIFTDMAASLAVRQQPNGFWCVNLDDPLHAQTSDPTYVDCPETSGTAFFTYGLAWGVRNGLLSATEFGPTIVAAWNGLHAEAIQHNGRLGWCQTIGKEPESGQPFDEYRTADFCVGAFLLAASEVAQLACGPMPEPGEIFPEFTAGWWSRTPFSETRSLGPRNIGRVAMHFDIVPYATTDMDGVVAYADSSTAIASYSANAVLVRLRNGVYDAYDFDGYRADAAIAYTPGESHRVRIDVDLSAKTYDVWITPPGGAETRLAADFRFRAAAPPTDDLGQVTLITSERDGDFAVFNHRIAPMLPNSSTAVELKAP